MDRFDRDIVRFVLVWIPFGGPPDDEILPRFGLTPPQLIQRFDRIVAGMLTSKTRLSGDEAELLSAVRRVTDRRARIDHPAWRRG